MKSSQKIKVALVCDPLEEHWPSMDLVGDMLFHSLSRNHPEFEIQQLRPPIKLRFGRIAKLGQTSKARNLDRLIHRFHTYPVWLRKVRDNFDLFHIVDHSYSQLAHELPAQRTVVSCHDLDTFECILDPTKLSRSLAFRLMTRRILSGLIKSKHVLCVSETVHSDLLASGLVPSHRASVIYNGTHPSCSPLPNATAAADLDRLLGHQKDSLYLLHVGSTIPRKRIEILLRVFSEVTKRCATVRLVRVGGEFTESQEELAKKLNIRELIDVMPYLDREVLAALYRRAALVLLTSDAEGFGLPLVEAMACGCPVVASDISVFREIGGTAATFCPVGEVAAWAQNIETLLLEKEGDTQRWRQRRETAFRQASHFTWQKSAAKCAEIYKTLTLEPEPSRAA